MIESMIEDLKEDKTIELDILTPEDTKEDFNLSNYTRTEFREYVESQSKGYKSKRNTDSTEVFISENDAQLIMELTTEIDKIDTSSETLSELVDFGFRQWIEFYGEYISALDSVCRLNHGYVGYKSKTNKALSQELKSEIKKQNNRTNIPGDVKKTKVTKQLNSFLNFYTDLTGLDKETLSTLFLNFGLFWIGKRSKYEFEYEESYDIIEDRFHRYESLFISHVTTLFDRYMFSQISNDRTLLIHKNDYPSNKLEKQIEMVEEKDKEKNNNEDEQENDDDFEITEPVDLDEEK